MTAWIFLTLAGIFEVLFASTLKLTENFTKLYPTLVFITFAVLSFYFLTKAIESIPVGTAYVIWTGIGAVGTVLVGIFYYNEPAGLLRLFFISTLVISIVGLKLVSN
jgi:quaternary ammonium compound-resistance protein SugE